MLVAGLAAFPLYALTRGERLERQPLAAIWRAERGLCAAGLLLSALGMAVLAASMQGVGVLSLELQPFWDLVRETDVGIAWITRSAALLLALAASIWMTRRPATAAVTLAAAGSVAVATLVWSGHAGRSEEHTSELQSLMRNSYAVFCLKKRSNTHTYSQKSIIKRNKVR